jgi:hypothetical protein
MKKTEWFPANVKPVRVGVYRVEKSFGVVWAHWNGKSWSHGCTQRNVPADVAWFYDQAYPVIEWRGLAEKPE